MTTSFTATASSLSASIADSLYAAYFQNLQNLLLKVIITTKDGRVLDPQTGTDQAVDLIERVKAAGKKVLIVGNGGSAAIASHQAIDLWNAAHIPAVTFNDPALLTCLSNDYGYENVFSRAINTFAASGDVLIAISSSGKSSNILNAAEAGRKKGCSVITFAGFSSTAPLLSMGDLNFYIDSQEYGAVEVSHAALIHYLTDAICVRHKGEKQ